MKTMPSRQRGLSLITWMIILLVAAVLGTAAFRMIPAYMEYNTIASAIRSVLQDNKVAMMSAGELRQGLSKRFIINQVDAIQVDDLVISKDGGVLTISVDYEVSEPMFYNVSIVMTFKEDFTKDVRQ